MSITDGQTDIGNSLHTITVSILHGHVLCYLFIYRILKQMTGFCLLLFVPFPVPEVPPLECSYSGYVFVLDLVKLSQM